MWGTGLFTREMFDPSDLGFYWNFTSLSDSVGSRQSCFSTKILVISRSMPLWQFWHLVTIFAAYSLTSLKSSAGHTLTFAIACLKCLHLTKPSSQYLGCGRAVAYMLLYISCNETSNSSRCERPVNWDFWLDQNESFDRGTVTLQNKILKNTLLTYVLQY